MGDHFVQLLRQEHIVECQPIIIINTLLMKHLFYHNNKYLNDNQSTSDIRATTQTLSKFKRQDINFLLKIVNKIVYRDDCDSE